MLRSDLIRKLGEDHPGLRSDRVERALGTLLETMTTHLRSGGRVEMRGFGTFSTRVHDAHTGHNPRTGAVVDVPRKRAVRFKPAKAMADRLNNSDPQLT